MRLQSKAVFALAALTELLRHENGDYAAGHMTLKDIAKANGVSVSYLEQLFSKMLTAGIVHAKRGPGGGYRLARAANLIFVSDVVRCVDDEWNATKPGAFYTAEKYVFDFFEGVSLIDALKMELA